MRIACVQCDVAFAEPMVNAERAAAQLRSLRAEGVDLAVFPEAFLSGYCVECLEDAERIAIPSTHAALQLLQSVCDETGILCIVGYAESFSATKLRNTVALLQPGVPARTYSKTHLPELGYDKFVEAGDHLNVFETRLGKIGMIICYDLRLPEAARVLALKGAELIVLPTNWPVGAEVSADTISIARAAENRVFLATCDRVGEEHGYRFIGRSKIVSPSGKVLASAGADEEVIIADIDLAEARQKRIVGIPGKYEMEIFESRNPALYQAITDQPQ